MEKSNVIDRSTKKRTNQELVAWLDTWANTCNYLGDFERCKGLKGYCGEALKQIKEKIKMDSPNITHVPLNRDGAIELGQSPCSICDTGWGNYSVDRDGKSVCETCHDTCKLLEKYYKQQGESDGFFGTHIREVVKTVKDCLKK